MKKEIKKLELLKLFKEFSFLKIDEEYKLEVINTYGPEFAMAIKDVFNKNPDLDLLYNSKTDIASSDSKENNLTVQNCIGIENFSGDSANGLDIIILNQPVIEIPNKEDKKGSEIKKLYRKIATKTHPDKVTSKLLNDLYLKAKNAYQINDLFSIYLICSELNIDFEFPKDELDNFKFHIRDLKNRNLFMEQTYLWAWVNEEKDITKNNIILHYITKLPNFKT